MILVDFNQVVISNLFVNAKQYADQIEPELVRSMVLTSLKRYRRKFHRHYGELVICVDGKNPWRKAIFPYYKENRKEQKKKSKVNWETIMKTVYMIADELDEYFPYKVVCVPRCEADDVIAILAKQYHQQEPVLVVSADKDLIQLQKYDGVSQYDPIRDRVLETENPKMFLIEHILRGDDSDGVPNFMSDDDVFMNKAKRQKPIYQKKLDTWLGDFETFKADPLYTEHKDNIKRNRILIDLSFVPEKLEEKILERYDVAERKPRSSLMTYFANNGLGNMLEHIGDF